MGTDSQRNPKKMLMTSLSACELKEGETHRHQIKIRVLGASPGPVFFFLLDSSPLLLSAAEQQEANSVRPSVLSQPSIAMALKVYADRRSQPSRAIIIFCKANRIDFEEVTVDLFKAQHRTPEFTKINPMGQVPTIVDGRFRLFESHAILRYLATVFPGVPDHWYPADLFTRAKVESILDWHHSNLRRGAATYVLHAALGPSLGLTPNPETAKEGEKLLSRSLRTIETVWLKGDAKFLNGNPQPSIADLSLVCEITQLEVVGDERRDRILEPHVKVRAWMENVKKATSPHFDEVHQLLLKVKARLSSAAPVKTTSKL